MTEPAAQIILPPSFPDHTQLPESDGTFVKNFQEHPQSIILTGSIGDLLLIGSERAEQEHQRAARLVERLRAMGVNLNDQDFT